jgi:hypothetical protein
MCRLPKIFDPSRILEMPESLIEAIGGESEERRVLRGSLQAKLDIFAKSSMICKMYSDVTDQTRSASSTVMLEDTSPEKVVVGSTASELTVPWAETGPAFQTPDFIPAVFAENDLGVPTTVPPKGKKAKAAKAKESIPKDSAVSSQT